MIKKIIWPAILVAAIALSLVFVTGFVSSIIITNGDQVLPQEPVAEKVDEEAQSQPASADKTILVLGDSIGFGIGDEADMGIGRRYAELIDPERAEAIQVRNLSVSGAVSSDLATVIAGPENEPLLSAADTIIIAIGGNDLNRLQFEDRLSLESAFQETFNTYKENLDFILKRIRTLNPEAQIALIGLYDPYAEADGQKTKKLLEWNYQTHLLAQADLKTVYVPNYEQFKYHLESYLSADQFHPSPLGYQVITEELDRIINGKN